MKKILCICAALAATLSTAGCSDKPVSESGESAAIDISELDLKVEEVIDDSKRNVMFWFTNNSDYTITYYNLRFRPKSDITKADFEKFKDFGENYPDDWDVDYVFMDAEYGDDDAYADGDDEEFVKPGETSEKEDVHRNNIMYVRDIEIYNCMEPDILTIQYIDKDEKEHRLNYDYKNQKYNEEKMRN